jgi:hypothetical protein
MLQWRRECLEISRPAHFTLLMSLLATLITKPAKECSKAFIGGYARLIAPLMLEFEERVLHVPFTNFFDSRSALPTLLRTVTPVSVTVSI